MSLDQLQAVVTIAEEGTIVRAARLLHISQPPLTRKLRALEDELGVELFDRGARGMRPTLAGQAFVASARGILAAVDEAAATVRAAATSGPPDPRARRLEGGRGSGRSRA
ncbi:MAG: LysR family transcriptional regulator [Pseudomonadota bacterium]|nr:LysR family transcriptional regulator [Pseudomonadota bacterium]